jgi:alpha-mannosidase
MSERIKVHMIGNAHLDPVWLWSWQAGVDEAIATAYTAVKLLKEYPEFIFTRSDSWFHQMIEKLNPELFEEVKKLVAEGRWQLVGGWHIQPDCNLPTEYGFRKQIEIGQRYFEERFGKKTKIGYNVDSFGHAGTLPRILKEAGYHSYIYMRPGAHEKQYPSKSQVFWWEASDSKDRVLAYRIPIAYCCHTVEQLKTFIPLVIEQSDTSLGHIMCFYGVGDHGGGPTREQIEFILNNRETYDGAELILSHPQAYFDAIAGKTQKLPVVKGELQYHAIGCYSVLHHMKQEVRKSEHKLIQAERVARKFSAFTNPKMASILRKGWQDVLFNQFHDTYGGTCLKSAYPVLFDQLGRAKANAEEEMTYTLRRYSETLPKLELGPKTNTAFFAVMNSGSEAFNGWVEHEFFGLGDLTDFKLVQIDPQTKKQREVVCQKIRAESSIMPEFLRILFPAKLTNGETQLFGIRRKSAKTIKTDLKAKKTQIQSRCWQAKVKSDGLALAAKAEALGFKFQVLEDLSDTWSHDINRLGGKQLGNFVQTRSFLEESGPLRANLVWEGSFRHSKIQMQTRIYRDENWMELVIHLLWNEPQAILKMILSPKAKFTSRLDGCAGGSQERSLDGHEYPFQDWTLLKNAGGSLAVISPDIFGVDAQKENIRFTLVRSPAYAHHHPATLDDKTRRYQFIDMGEHEYRVLIGSADKFNPKQLRMIAEQIQQQPIHWDPPYRSAEQA